MGVNRPVGLPRGHAADDVADGDASRALALRLAERREGIGRFPGLGDDDRQRLGGHDWLAIPILGPVIDLDGDPGELLDHELADQPGMPGRPAREDGDPFDFGQLAFGDLHLLEEDLP